LILLRQFKRLLAKHDVELTDTQMQQIGQHVADANSQPDAALIDPVKLALAAIITESVDLLGDWELTYAQSLAATMDDVGGWETTADFLEIANEKINAEIRISAGAALLTLLGDHRSVQFLLETIDHDLKTAGDLDVDAMMAKRALLHAANINAEDDDWLAKARAWAQTHQ